MCVRGCFLCSAGCELLVRQEEGCWWWFHNKSSAAEFGLNGCSSSSSNLALNFARSDERWLRREVVIELSIDEL
jgi:hypothetical protein